MGKLIRTNFDRREQRRDRRCMLPAITVTIAEKQYAVVDWSLGGFQPEGELDVQNGQQVTGTVTIAGHEQSYEFTAEAVCRDGRSEGLGFRFVDRSQSLINALDRAFVARLMGRRA
jgi:PilZ domain-containing protein